MDVRHSSATALPYAITKQSGVSLPHSVVGRVSSIQAEDKLIYPNSLVFQGTRRKYTQQRIRPLNKQSVSSALADMSA